MNDYLTTRQAEDLLRVDRATIYRMLGGGRLKGSKIGSQWRILRADVERLLRGEIQVAATLQANQNPVLPVECIQAIQDMFSKVSRLGAVLVDQGGVQVTRASGQPPFCQRISSSCSGSEACLASRQEIARRSRDGNRRFTCHAGLNYLATPLISHEGRTALAGVLFFIGPFYWQSPAAEEEARRVRQIAEMYCIPYAELAGTVHTVPVIPLEMHAKVEDWARAITQAIVSVVQERAIFSLRMQQIASLTQIP